MATATSSLQKYFLSLSAEELKRVPTPAIPPIAPVELPPEVGRFFSLFDGVFGESVLFMQHF